jgi:hypothetical protein
VVIESSPEAFGPDSVVLEPDTRCGLPHQEQNCWFRAVDRPQCEQVEAIGWRKTK